jgi:hypothetical protein
MTGSAREDVSAKAVALNQNRGSLNLAGPQDALQRTDFLLARNILSLVQEFYTEPRILNITANRLTSETEQVEVNQPDLYTGAILNDLTIGEYDIIVSNTPARETLEDSQFEQAVSLRELGVNIPDETLIENSRLNRRGDIIKQMREASSGEEAQRQKQLEDMAVELELAKKRSEAERAGADAELKTAKAEETLLKARIEAQNIGQDLAQRQQEALARMAEAEAKLAEREMELAQSVREFEEKMRQNAELHDQKIEQDQEKHALAMEQREEQNKAAKQQKPATKEK